jgi:hypothetical protein
MQSSVTQLFHSPITVLLMSAVIGLVSISLAAAQEWTTAASRVPTKALVDQKVLPGPVLVDSATPRSQARPQSFGRPILGPENPTPVSEENACRIIEATLLYKNGPNGGLVLAGCH